MLIFRRDVKESHFFSTNFESENSINLYTPTPEKPMKQLLLVFIFALLFVGTTSAQHADKAPKAKVATETVSKGVCPVTGEEVDPDVSYTYKGTKYYFCCNNCVTKFKKNPVKYIKASSKKSFDACNDHGKTAGMEKAVEAPATAVINTGKDMSKEISNTTCPVMNEEVDKKVTTVSYKGKVYGFCCKACIKKFAADPEKYLKN
jgi:YHS domain-containing protein